MAGPNFKNAGKACEARVDAAERQGRRQRPQDRARAPSTTVIGGANLTAAQDLVTNRKVFAVVNNSSFAFPLVPLHPATPGFRLIGGGFDQPHWTRRATRTSSPRAGTAALRPPASSSTNVTEVTKKLGATEDAAIVVRRESPSSTGVAKDTQDYAVPSLGSRARVPEHRGRLRHHRRRTHRARASRTPAPTRCTCPSTATPTSPSRRASSRTASPMKAIMMASGYGQDMLDSPVTQDPRLRTTSCRRSTSPPSSRTTRR